MNRFSLALFLVSVPVVFAQEAIAPTGPKPVEPRRDMRQFLGLGALPDAAAAARGETLYVANCAFCHGAKATGAEAPDLVRSTLVLHDEKGEAIGPVIHSGRPDKGMPSFASLSEAQLYDLVEFLHMRVELSVNRGLYQVQNIVTGDAAAGKSYFEGAGKCSSCHSVTGDLAHIGSKMSPADLQQTFLYPAARKPEVWRVTVSSPDGGTVTGTLKRVDDFTVSLMDTAGSYHEYSRMPDVRVKIEDKLLVHRQLLDQYTDTDMHDLTAYLVSVK
jgi:cytochrome c oxidase cbb3-type subunit 3